MNKSNWTDSKSPSRHDYNYQSMTKQTKSNSEQFVDLATELKYWFEIRDIDLGPTDTYCGQLASWIQSKVKHHDEQIIEWLQGEKVGKTHPRDMHNACCANYGHDKALSDVITHVRKRDV